MTAIQWTNETWNPTTGCDRVSPGCDNCYALTMASRLKGMGQEKYQRDGNSTTSGPGFGVTVHHDELSKPLKWRKSRRIFVDSMGDLFHDDVSDDFIARVWATMAATPQHTYQILTKRHGRMRSLLSDPDWDFQFAIGAWRGRNGETAEPEPDPSWGWPLPNVWTGVSIEDQKRADLRIPALLDTPAAVRFLSCEPLLGPVDLSTTWTRDGTLPVAPLEQAFDQDTGLPSRGIHWVIAGGESGPGARPMHPDWARSLRDQCAATRTPFFFKQWGGRTPKAGGRELDGRTWDEFPVGDPR